MTRRELEYAPEIAVVVALCATAQAASAALAALHRLDQPEPLVAREQRLARSLCAAIARLSVCAAAYQSYVSQLAAPTALSCDDIHF